MRTQQEGKTRGMRTQQELRDQLRKIDRKGYKAYKVLEGEYDFGTYRLCIDHVQGDPFATPSRVRIVYFNRTTIPEEYINVRHRRIAVEDALLRRLHRSLRACSDGGRKGSGKSGLVTACRTGQEILERTAKQGLKWDSLLLAGRSRQMRLPISCSDFCRKRCGGRLADRGGVRH